MGEKQNQPFQLSFNASLKVDFQGSRVTSGGGLILVRKLDERLGFGELIDRRLVDRRRGKNTQLPLADLLRHSVYGRRRERHSGPKANGVRPVLRCPPRVAGFRLNRALNPEDRHSYKINYTGLWRTAGICRI